MEKKSELTVQDILRAIEASRKKAEQDRRRADEDRRRADEETQELKRALSASKRETDRQLQETDRQLRKSIAEVSKAIERTTEQLRETSREVKSFLGGYGDISEEYFYQSLQKKMQLGTIKFDSIERNVIRGREYDLLLINGDCVAIIEVKSRANPAYLKAERQLKDFKEDFQEYKKHKLYFGVATMSTKNEELVAYCKEKGFFLLTQNGEHLEVLNSDVRSY